MWHFMTHLELHKPVARWASERQSSWVLTAPIKSVKESNYICNTATQPNLRCRTSAKSQLLAYLAHPTQRHLLSIHLTTQWERLSSPKTLISRFCCLITLHHQLDATHWLGDFIASQITLTWAMIDQTFTRSWLAHNISSFCFQTTQFGGTELPFTDLKHFTLKGHCQTQHWLRRAGIIFRLTLQTTVAPQP